MITLPNLKTALLDLLHQLKGTDIRLIIGGRCTLTGSGGRKPESLHVRV